MPETMMAYDQDTSTEAPIPTPVLTTKIALVGFTASRSLAPWTDREWEVYGCNNLHLYVPESSNAAGWFDLHDRETIENDDAHVRWLTTTNIPVYAWRPREDWTSAIPYPRDEVLDYFASLRGARYFTNSISWMTAWAIMRLGPALEAGLPCELGIYGVDMAQTTEYAAQRPSCEYWIGIAEAAGITVHIPEESDLLKAATLYGAEDDSALRTKLKARSRELEEKAHELAAEEQRTLAHLEEVRAMQHQMAGALESNNYILGVWMQPGNDPRGGGDDPSVLAQSDGHKE